MLQLHHNVDLNFREASPFLKQVLTKHFGSKGRHALDIPCGNGRNIFLLANYFETVSGSDCDSKYLAAIKKAMPRYGKNNIDLEQKDILREYIADLDQFDFVCNIHFFDLNFIQFVVGRLAPGTLFLLETPECRGGNFSDLPAEAQLLKVFGGCEILYYSFRQCPQKDNNNNTGAARILIKK